MAINTATFPRRVGISAAEAITGLHRTTIWRKVRQPGGFPPPTYIGNRRTWIEDDLRGWVAAQAARPPDSRRGARNLQGTAGGAAGQG
jgi:predicted DNA-binding transcriptional regulator AlpA